jgi:hypothetical protein
VITCCLPRIAYDDIQFVLRALSPADASFVPGTLLQAVEEYGKRGEHPHPLPPRPPIEAFVAVDTENGHLVLAFFARLDNTRVVFVHFAGLSQGPGYTTALKAAWAFARQRYIDGGY